MKKYILILLILGLAISGCNYSNLTSSDSLIGSWKLISFGSASAPTPAVAGADAGITYNNDRTITGNSGCNGFGGKYKVDGNQITFSEIASTLMACDDARTAQETAVKQVLTGTATYKIEGNTLTLTNNNMVLILTTVSYP